MSSTGEVQKKTWEVLASRRCSWQGTLIKDYGFPHFALAAV